MILLFNDAVIQKCRATTGYVAFILRGIELHLNKFKNSLTTENNNDLNNITFGLISNDNCLVSCEGNGDDYDECLFNNINVTKIKISGIRKEYVRIGEHKNVNVIANLFGAPANVKELFADTSDDGSKTTTRDILTQYFFFVFLSLFFNDVCFFCIVFFFSSSFCFFVLLFCCFCVMFG